MIVVDLGDSIAGRFTARLLALDGADVTRIAPAGSKADVDCVDVEFLDGYLDDGVAVVRGEPAAIIAERIRAADVVLTSFDMGAYHGGFDDDTVRIDNNDVVNVTTSSFGTSGPYADWRGGPFVDWAAGGYLYLTGEPTREPIIGPLHLCAYVAGYTAAIAVEAAILRAQETGVGSHVDISTMEAMLCVHQSTFERVAAGVGRHRTGRYTEVYPLTVRPVRDGFVALGVVTDAEFDRLLIALGRTDMLTDDRFTSVGARMVHRDALDAELDPVLTAHDSRALVELLQAHNVPAAAVASERDVLVNEQLRARDFWRPVDCGDRVGNAPGNPVRLGAIQPTAPTGSRATADRRPTSASGHTLPLTGRLVLDFTAFWAGPSSTRILADLGATVITIERPGGRFDLDVDDPSLPDEQVVAGLYHHSMNRGKQNIVLDLRTEADRGRARELARTADIVVENYRPGIMRRFGLGPADLFSVNQSLIYVSLSGFGSTGPWSQWGSYGPMIEAASSVEHRTGYTDGPPLRLGHTLPDGAGGLVGALAALRGLRHRWSHGMGSWYDISQLEAYVAMSGDEVLAASILDRDAPRVGNRSTGMSVQGVFAAEGIDDWVAVRSADPSPPDRAVEDRIASSIALEPKVEAARRLQELGFEAFPAATPNDLLCDPQLAAREFFQRIPFRTGSVSLAGTPFRAVPSIASPGAVAPRVDEHTPRRRPHASA